MRLAITCTGAIFARRECCSRVVVPILLGLGYARAIIYARRELLLLMGYPYPADAPSRRGLLRAIGGTGANHDFSLVEIALCWCRARR